MADNLNNYRKDKKPIAQLKQGEQVLGGDSRYINPIRKTKKKPAKKSFIDRLFNL